MVKLISRDYNTRYSVFAVDTTAELDKLPTNSKKGKDDLSTITCCIGSRAIVTETSERYILNGNQNKWIKFTASSSGGGGGGSEPQWESL